MSIRMLPGWNIFCLESFRTVPELHEFVSLAQSPVASSSVARSMISNFSVGIFLKSNWHFFTRDCSIKNRYSLLCRTIVLQQARELR
jgi:hypothetical protein